MPADFSPRGRAANLARMASQNWDVLVVGGGIVGAGIARDAAMRGLATALVERGDFASGTSSKTSRLVHGGLRYLKNFKIGLVRQAVRERDTLLREAPALVRPLAFTIPCYAGRGMGRRTLRFGLWVYDFLSRDKLLPRRQWLTPQSIKEREPQLGDSHLVGGGVYHDALTDDARFVLFVIRAAAAAGAVVANHAEVTELLRTGGRVAGAKVRDRMTEETFEMRASVVVNATGVWIDGLRMRPAEEGTLRPTKGIHVFLPREKVRNHEAVVLSAKQDGRMLFVLPWDRLTLVGTTDTDFRGAPDRVLPEAEDVAYLLDSVNAAFPDAKVGAQDVVSAYAGLRPMVREDTVKEESDVSREHEIFEDSDGLLSVAGGKLTTHRAMAKEVVDRVEHRLKRRAACRTGEALFGPSPTSARELQSHGFDDTAAAYLGRRHEPGDLIPFLQEPSAHDAIVPGHPYRWVEVCAAVEREMALALQDVMVRRLGLFYETADQGIAVARAVAERMARHLGWDDTRIGSEVQRYREQVADHRRFLESHVR